MNGFEEQLTDAASVTTANTDETTRDRLLSLVLLKGCRLFRDFSDRTFIRVPVASHSENWEIDSKSFRRYLRKLWRDTTKLTIGSSTVDEVVKALDAEAAFGSERFSTYIRIAHANDEIYIDLGDEDWKAIQVTKNGWSIVSDPPVMFLRADGMLPLPTPVKKGNLDKLKDLLNIKDDKTWRLTVAWLLAAYSPGPFPVFVILGEHGAAKSYFAGTLRKIVDPNEAPSVRAPKEERDVIMGAASSHVTSLENLSSIPNWLSDMLCCIATGAAYKERAYHTNNGSQVLFKAKRPIILNGINLKLADDLASRAIVIELENISDERRIEERVLNARVEKELPGLLGATLDVLVSILKKLPKTKLPKLKRMADFTLWVTAAESALRWETGSFYQILSENTDNSAQTVIDSDLFGARLRVFMQNKPQSEKGFNDGWEELLVALAGGDKMPPYWPATSQAVSAKLRRLAPALRTHGIQYSHFNDGVKRTIKIWNEPSGTSTVLTDTKKEPSASYGKQALLFDSVDGSDASFTDSINESVEVGYVD
jgi:hypothetical protein